MTVGEWRGRRVFVTGHTGFKGAWLSLWLHHMGAEVSGYALAPGTDPSLFTLAGVGDSITSTISDIRDGSRLTAAMQAANPEVVFHLAAQPIVRRSYADPVETYSTNVMGTVNLFEAVRATPSVRAVVNVTSDKCYENPEWDWACREVDPMGGHDPYSSSKGCAELVTSAYRRSFFSAPGPDGRRVALASARAGNVIGGGDWAPDRLIPDMVRGIASGAETIVRNPGAVRPWQHVLEPLSGYLLLAERLLSDPEKYADGWNFGPLDEDAVPVGNVVAAFSDATSGKARWRAEPDPKGPHEARLLRLDIAKARTHLGWRPRWRLKTALDETAKWYLGWLAGNDMRRDTLDQIDRFGAAA